MFLVLIRDAKMTILEKQKGEQKNGLMNIEAKTRNRFAAFRKDETQAGQPKRFQDPK